MYIWADLVGDEYDGRVYVGVADNIDISIYCCGCCDKHIYNTYRCYTSFPTCDPHNFVGLFYIWGNFE